MRISGGTILGLSLNFVTWIRDDGWRSEACRIMITIRYRVLYRVRNRRDFKMLFKA
jgi:hypothetical protein